MGGDKSKEGGAETVQKGGITSKLWAKLKIELQVSKFFLQRNCQIARTREATRDRRIACWKSSISHDGRKTMNATIANRGERDYR